VVLVGEDAILVEVGEVAGTTVDGGWQTEGVCLVVEQLLADEIVDLKPRSKYY
jgi:hypothetical protein